MSKTEAILAILDNYTWFMCHLLISNLKLFHLQAQIKVLTDKLEAAETAAADHEREANKLRMDNEKLEKDLVESEEKFKSMQDSLRSAMADLNNV